MNTQMQASEQARARVFEWIRDGFSSSPSTNAFGWHAFLPSNFDLLALPSVLDASVIVVVVMQL